MYDDSTLPDPFDDIPAHWFAKVPRAVLVDLLAGHLTSGDLAVFTCIAIRVKGSSGWVVNQAALAAMAGCSRENVSRSVKRLTDRGHVFTAPCPGPNRTLRYFVRQAPAKK